MTNRWEFSRTWTGDSTQKTVRRVRRTPPAGSDPRRCVRHVVDIAWMRWRESRPFVWFLALTPYSLVPADCLAVIPARDEAATVGSVVADVRRVLGCEVLVVDDASTDDTVARARAAGARVLTLPLGLGAWGASQAGIRYALRHGFAGVISLDADGQHLPESLPSLFDAGEQQHADVVIGTCIERLSVPKRIAWQYLRLLTGLPLRDFTSGLRLYNAAAVRALAAPEASLLDYQDVGVLMLLAKQGFKIVETPTPMQHRVNGHSRVFASWAVVARYMFNTTILCISRVDRGRSETTMQARKGSRPC